jgi:hypothetical protein
MATDTHATIEELFEMMFSMRPMPKLCDDQQDQAVTSQSHETEKYGHESSGTWNQERLCWLWQAAVCMTDQPTGQSE